jgi:hypothetical protein
MTLAFRRGSFSNQTSMVSVQSSMRRFGRGRLFTLGGADGASSPRYFFAVRQSQPASRAISAQQAPAATSGL